MKLLIISDIHGNLPAFESVLKHAGWVDGYLSLGDVVGYGPWSNQCVQLLSNLNNVVALKGNHEEFYLQGKCINCSPVAAAFFHQTVNSFSEQTIIATYRDSYLLGSFLATHTYLNRYIYPDSQVMLDRNRLIGHSHHQFTIADSGYLLINPGSVGQNRTDLTQAQYCLFDTTTETASFKHCTYPFEEVLTKMKEERYPTTCLDYYLSKIPSRSN